jgi:hypothetical protein
MNKLLKEPSAQLKIPVRHFSITHTYIHTLSFSVTLSRHFIIIIILEGKQNDFVSNIYKPGQTISKKKKDKEKKENLLERLLTLTLRCCYHYRLLLLLL